MKKDFNTILKKLNETLISEAATNKSNDYRAEISPLIKLLNYTIELAIQLKASDIHIEPYSELIRLRYRIGGDLKEINKLPKKFLQPTISRIKVMANLDIVETRLPQEGRMRYVYKGNDIDLRVSIVPTAFGEKIVIRILDKNKNYYNLENLGFSNKNYNLLKKLIRKKSGMILVTGSTGSGKTTTLYSILKKINNNNKNIMTIEDPIEYIIEGVNQVEINEKLNLKYDNMVPYLLRQDPDILMIGEIRDNKTALETLKASMTGHLVLSTMHANDSISAISRLKNMGIPNYLISESIIAIIHQRLGKRLCSNCRYINNKEVKIDKFIIKQNYKSRGCQYCNNGISGQIGIHEILVMTDEIKDAISKGDNKSELSRIAFKDNPSIHVDIKNKIEKGIISIKEFYNIM